MKNYTILAELRGKGGLFLGICVGARIASRIHVSCLAQCDAVSTQQKADRSVGTRPSLLLLL